jgi:hypothetical protein
LYNHGSVFSTLLPRMKKSIHHGSDVRLFGPLCSRSPWQHFLTVKTVFQKTKQMDLSPRCTQTQLIVIRWGPVSPGVMCGVDPGSGLY